MQKDNTEEAENKVPPRRHCMVVHASYPMGETRVEREARALVDRGVQVDVICLRKVGEAAFEVVDGVSVFRVPVRRHKSKGAFVQLLEYLAFFMASFLKLNALHHNGKYNVIQVHNLPDWLIFTALYPKMTGARLILDLHDLMPEFYAARFNRPLDSLPVKLLIWLEKVSCAFADHVITVTEGWKETLIRRGIPASKVSVVMNLADTRVFCEPCPSEQFGSQDGHFNLLYHGNLTHRYGIDLAIQAVNLSRDQIPAMHFHIHGWGDARPSLINQVNDLGLQNVVSFSTQSLQTDELPGLIRKADVCVVPYRRDVFTDGILPTKLMEYAALGMPVIAVRTPAISAYFDENMVEFFTPGDVRDLARCLLELHQDRARLVDLSNHVQQFNQRYTWSTQSAQYFQLVAQLG